MASITLTFVGDGLEEILQRACNKVATDTWKLKSYSNSITWDDEKELGDVTESANYTGQDVDPANLSTSFSSPNATLTYTGDITFSYTGASAYEGTYLTNQAGDILIAGGDGPSRVLGNGDEIVNDSFDVVMANA